VATGYSFPSAEAALSIGLVAIALALAGIAGPRTGRAALAAAALLILSLGALLISVRVHYLTDVLAGWALGTIVFALFGAVVLALDRRPCARAAPATQPRSGSRLS
jgi:undecaprenyl-diphosphatase